MLNLLWQWAHIVFTLILTESHAGLSMSEEKQLIKQLIDNYTTDGKFGRPIKSMNGTLRVGYSLTLVQIIDVNEKDQVLTTNVWCKYQWRDESIHWVPAEHDNITIVRVPVDSIWRPDFVLYNYADERLAEHRPTLALIAPDGNVTHIPTAIFKSTCFIDTTYFPFDEQNCHMKFGSWTYNGNAVDPFFLENKDYIGLSEYVPSQEWIILEHWAVKNVAYYECCPNEPYPDLTFHLKLRRRGTFYSYFLILPCVLLSFITMVLFMLPPETPAKMLLGINIFVAFFMLLLLLKDATPPTAKQIPIIGAYYCFNMVMTTVSTFLCAILVDMHYRADKRSPPNRWLTYLVIGIVGRAMFMHVPREMMLLLGTQKHEIERRHRHIARLRSRCLRLNQLAGLSKPKRGSQKTPTRSCLVRGLERAFNCVVVKAPQETIEIDLNETAPEMRHPQRCLDISEDIYSRPSEEDFFQFSSDKRPKMPISRTVDDSVAKTTCCSGSTNFKPQSQDWPVTQFSHTRRGVYVGSTTERQIRRFTSMGNCLENPNITHLWRKNWERNRNRISFLPSSSFDLDHYNKFNADNQSLTSMTMDPTITKIEKQLYSHNKAMSRARRRESVRNYVNAKLARGNSFSHNQQATMIAEASSGLQMTSIEGEIQLIRTMLAKLSLKVAEKEINKRNAEAWRIISMILDRVFLYGYVVSMIVSLTTLFPQRPPELSDVPKFPNGTFVNKN